MKYVLEKFSTIPYQIFFLIGASVILCALLYRPITEFHVVGKEPSVLPVNAQAFEKWGSEPVKIKTGFSITDIIKFDTLKNEFLVNAIVWFAYDPQKINLATLEKFSFTKGEILKRSDPVIEKKSEHESIATYSLRVQFGTVLDYARFPLDDHRLFLNLTNDSIKAQDIVFEVAPTDYTIADNLYIAGWKVVGHDVKNGYSENKVGSQTIVQPKVIFSLDVSKQDLRQLLLIFLPLLLIFYVSIFAFSIKDIVLAITIILASISGLLAYAFVIQTISPLVGYFMLSDYFFIFVITSIFIIFLVTVLYAVPEHIASKKVLDTIKGVVIPILYILLIVVWYYLTNIKNMK